MRKPRLRAWEAGARTVFGSMTSCGLLIFASCWGRPMTRNSVLDGLSDRRLADLEKTDWSWLTEVMNLIREKEMQSWVRRRRDSYSFYALLHLYILSHCGVHRPIGQHGLRLLRAATQCSILNAIDDSCMASDISLEWDADRHCFSSRHGS